MSTHPNAILLLVLKPDGLSKKTMRDIMEFHGRKKDDDDIKIGTHNYNQTVMEEEYDESNQISADEGDLCFWDLFIYGYGEKILWSDLETRKNTLEEWAKTMCEKFNCSYKIYVTANYW